MDTPDDRPPAFFLSYARDDDDVETRTVSRLFRELNSVLAQRLGPKFGPGFMDVRDIEPGAEWPEDLRHALSNACAFVAVLSPTYFSRQYCGREWQAFASRLEGQLAGRGKASNLVQPVLLVPRVDLNDMPAVVALKQYTFAKYPVEYPEKGLRYLHALQGRADQYTRFIWELADVLVKAIKGSPLPPQQLPAVAEIQSAFHNKQTHTQQVSPDRPPGPHLFAQFVYVAASPAELANVRTECAVYGQNGGLEWQPFLPPVDREIGMIAAEVASRERFRYEPVALDADLIHRLHEASLENKIIVVMVDPWTVRLDRYKAWMRELDDHNFAACIVIVLLNGSDAESSNAAAHLRNAIGATFVNRQITSDPELVVSWVSTEEDLERQLATALQRAKIRVLNRQEILRRAMDIGAFDAPPVLQTVVS